MLNDLKSTKVYILGHLINTIVSYKKRNASRYLKLVRVGHTVYSSCCFLRNLPVFVLNGDTHKWLVPSGKPIQGMIHSSHFIRAPQLLLSILPIAPQIGKKKKRPSSTHFYALSRTIVTLNFYFFGYWTCFNDTVVNKLIQQTFKEDLVVASSILSFCDNTTNDLGYL